MAAIGDVPQCDLIDPFLQERPRRQDRALTCNGDLMTWKRQGLFSIKQILDGLGCVESNHLLKLRPFQSELSNSCKRTRPSDVTLLQDKSKESTEHSSRFSRSREKTYRLKQVHRSPQGLNRWRSISKQAELSFAIRIDMLHGQEP